MSKRRPDTQQNDIEPKSHSAQKPSVSGDIFSIMLNVVILSIIMQWLWDWWGHQTLHLSTDIEK